MYDCICLESQLIPASSKLDMENHSVHTDPIRAMSMVPDSEIYHRHLKYYPIYLLCHLVIVTLRIEVNK
jgi:hypothetical protein